MLRRFAPLLVASALVGCSGGGGGSSNPITTPQSASPSTTAAIAIAVGSAPTAGTSAIIPVSLQAINASGTPISGTYFAPIVITSNDPLDIAFSASSSGASAATSISITNSTQSVYLVYDGKSLPAGTVVSASTTTASTAAVGLSSPSAGASSAPTTPAVALASLSIAENGAAPAVGTTGTFTLTVAAYNSSNQLITGAYSSPITVTTNDSADLQLSTGGASSSSVTLTSASQLIVVTYDGKAVPNGTQFTASAPGVQSVSTSFAPQGAGSSPAIASITISEVGASPILGSAGEFALNVTALSSTGMPITGTYATPILVTTNDSKDTMLASSQAGPFGSSVTLTSSGTPVLVQYDGMNVPTATQFVATSGSVTGSLTFNPQPTSATPYIAKLYVSGSGVSPNGSQGGAIPIFVTAYDQSGKVISGTFPSPVGVTLTNACDEGLSLNQSVNITPCATNGNVITNPAALTINSASQVLFLSYDSTAASSTSTPSYISISTNGIQCAAVNFLTTNNQFQSETCAAPASTPSPTFVHARPEANPLRQGLSSRLR